MANRERGEVSVDIDGTSYTLCLDLNAMCRLEEMFSTPGHEVTFQDVLTRVNQGNQRYTRAIFWAAFQKFHPEITLASISDLVQAAGGIMGFSEQLLGKMGLAVSGATNPDAEDLKALGIDAKKNTRRAQATRTRGTTRRSTGKRGKSG